MSLLMVLAMTNYEIVDGTGLTHCAPMVGHLTPVKVTCMLISTHTILHFMWSMVGTLLLLLLLIRPGSNRVGFNLKALWNAFWDYVIPLRKEWLRIIWYTSDNIWGQSISVGFSIQLQIIMAEQGLHLWSGLDVQLLVGWLMGHLHWRSHGR